MSKASVMAELYAVYGRGPDGAKCGECARLRTYHEPIVSAGQYVKCSLRRIAHSAQTDHWRTADACGKFEPRR